ncbi:PrtD family type I secretion system ABC transporter [Pseudochelatococcus lubricantis]|uniref:PrtD family type I secretion system ABC transporter n=1 Tax=Pseudochelatococcus lubricantis TaxID=1538102 RepID=A0ABX0UX96_9HYPH|nr:type I secretion system permease/ATPase [Pseudochelatococcus lubricantis]NIJ57028.1 PrtD family type I secretion system ABC transporter [Pseudochelatococcus lubricantis]
MAVDIAKFREHAGRWIAGTGDAVASFFSGSPKGGASGGGALVAGGRAAPLRPGENALDAAFRAARPAIMSAIFFSLFINVLGLVGPLYMMQVYDRVLSSRNVTTLLLLTLIVAILYVTAAILETVRTRLLVRGGVAFDGEVKTEAFDSVQRATIQQPSQGHTQVLRDVDTVREFFTGAGIIAGCDLPWVPVYVVVAFLLHPWYGLFAIITCIISAILAIANDRATRPVLDKATKASIAASGKASATFRNAEVLQAMGMISRLRHRWEESRSAALGWQAQASDRAGYLMAASRFNRMFSQSLILGLGAYLAINREISPGMMIAASIIVGRCTQPIEAAIGNWKGFVGMRGALKRVRALLKAVPPGPPRMRLPDAKGQLVVENLVVRAPGREGPVLKGVSFGVREGTILGVIGPSAAGKSSLARAIVGVWPAVAGAVRLDGSDLKHWDPEQLGQSLGYLPQDVELFAGTIAENVARFDAPDEAKVVQAAQMAGVHEMIQHLPQGYNTQIGEGGHALSGGQRQRIGLARAIYGLPALIVLDEPNANLDAAGEQALMNTIRALKQAKRTVVLVTHKTNILTLCDAILMIADGTVQAFGERDEVLARVMGPRVVTQPAPAVQQGGGQGKPPAVPGQAAAQA